LPNYEFKKFVVVGGLLRPGERLKKKSLKRDESSGACWGKRKEREEMRRKNVEARKRF